MLRENCLIITNSGEYHLCTMIVNSPEDATRFWTTSISTQKNSSLFIKIVDKLLVIVYVTFRRILKEMTDQEIILLKCDFSFDVTLKVLHSL
jgi:hypothetical protein